MVVTRRSFAILQQLGCWFAAFAVTLSTGCAVPWAKSAQDTELPLAESQAPRVYPKASSRKFAEEVASSDYARPPKPTVDDARLARELERLTKLNNELSRTLAAAEAKREEEKRREEPQRKPVGSGLPAVALPHEATPIEIALASNELAINAAKLEEKPKPADKPEAKPAEAKPPDDPKPKYKSGDWLQARDQAIAQLLEEISLARADKARSEEVAQLETQLRMHYALAGRRDDAARPVKELRQQEQEFWRHQAQGLIDLLGSDRLASESRRYAVALKSLEEAESHLAAAGSLALRNMALCRKVQDFGVIERFKSHDLARNQEVLLYVEVRNFTAREQDDHTYETELQGSYRILDRGGIARAERTLPLDKQTCANLRRDYYIAYRLYIPSELTPGVYTLELTIEDKKGNKSNNALLDFNVTQ